MKAKFCLALPIICLSLLWVVSPAYGRSDCMTTGNSSKCALDKPIAERNLAYCETYELKDDCYRTFASELNDETICEKMKKGQDDCYINVAKKKKDFSVCQKLVNQSNMQRCLLVIAKNVSDCANLIERKDTNLCYNLLGLWERDRVIKACVNRLKEFLTTNQEKNKTYLGVIDSENAVKMVQEINLGEDNPIIVHTSQNSFCMAKELSNGWYCVDSTGYEGGEISCSKDNISCKKQSYRDQLIAKIMRLIEAWQKKRS
ncbi:MAG: hypothetical protein MNSN_09860 [Minisyncoccus archaeiphilus]|nr:MAG: hypothetical protein MNSN_09860 [Candidatus Parcubacteria bacterium]